MKCKSRLTTDAPNSETLLGMPGKLRLRAGAMDSYSACACRVSMPNGRREICARWLGASSSMIAGGSIIEVRKAFAHDCEEVPREMD